MRCRIGSTTYPATFVSPTSISCPPTGPVDPGSYEIAVTDNGVDFVGAESPFTFLPATTVTTVSPSSGPFVSGGGRGQQPILLEGTGFSAMDRPSCSFGEMVVAASEVISATEVRCVPPTMPPLLGAVSKPLVVPVRFSNNGVDFGGCDYDHSEGGGAEPFYVFYNEPVVTSLAPSRGVTSGKTSTVLLTGTNLAKRGTATLPSEEDRALLCRLGPQDNNATASGVVLSPKEATCSVSCGNFSGLTSFEVSLNGGAHWTEADVGFRCDPLPETSSVTPEMGPTTGGTALTIRGSGFSSSELLGCSFGLGGTDNVSTVLSEARFISSSVIECVAPAASEALGPHTADVAVSNDGIHFSPPAPTATFEYVSPPMVTRIDPAFASASLGGASVTAIGTNFVNTPSSACHFTPLATNGGGDAADGQWSEFGTSIMVPAKFISSTGVSCLTSSVVLPVGPALVAVSVNGVDFDHNNGAIIDLEALPEVFKVVPARGMAGTMETPVEVGDSKIALCHTALQGRLAKQIGIVSAWREQPSASQLNMCSKHAENSAGTTPTQRISNAGPRNARRLLNVAVLDVQLPDAAKFDSCVYQQTVGPST